MIPLVLAAGFLARTPLDHTVTVASETVTIQQGDQLLLRIEVRFGLLRPANYLFGRLSSTTKALTVFVRRPGGAGGEFVRTADYGTVAPEPHPAADVPTNPPGHLDTVFAWVLSERDGPKPFKKGVPETNDRDSESPARDTPVFGAPGNHSVRVAVELRDRQGFVYSLESKAVVIRVEPQPREAQAASDAIRSMLYLVLPHAALKPGYAEKLRAALPALGESGAASAARRLLAIDALRDSKPGDGRRAAVEGCERLRATIPAAVRGEFDILAAGVAFDLGEYGPAVAWYNDIPHGPRKIELGVRYYFKLPEPLRKTMR